MTQKEELGFFPSIWLYIKGFGVRLLVHIIAVVMAIQLSGANEEYSGMTAMFATYVGCICLVARGSSLRFAWLMPTLLGFVQLFICFILGVPIVPAIFLGGLQTYLQRVFVNKFKMGFEWVVTLFLLLALLAILPLPSFMLSVSVFVAIFFVGILIGASKVHYLKKQEEAKKREEERLVREEFERNRDPLEEYRVSIKNLYPKQAWLPQNLQATLLYLTLSAESIIQCMVDDARDVKIGEKFLKRYLPAVHNVLDDYKRYCNSPQNETITNALAHSEEVLTRLAEAFAQEHQHLLRNNIDDFSANLRVLDTLLKMEGR